MKTLLLLSLGFAAFYGAALSDRPATSNWQIEVQARGKFELRLRVECSASRGVIVHAFKLQIIEGSPSERSLVLFQIGDRPHA